MEFAYPKEMEIAKKERWPILIPIGTMEYHSTICPYGCDSLVSMGIAREILHFTEELCAERGVKDIRIDTHKDNRAMRSLLKSMGYTHCGRITLLSGAGREAYHKNFD